VSWAPTQEEAERQALEEWPNGGMPFPKQDIKNPEDFANIAKLVRIENFANRMLISADLEEHVAQLQNYVNMGFDEIYLHNVGRNQAEFIETFGSKVVPQLKLA
ncbi:MAG: LLM class F420-dependent oxidoreductase, partial [Chloroflexota bacterium]|nr:LLM class F420-dependent oxidoreductase [Chloroflexota bacterium]